MKIRSSRLLPLKKDKTSSGDLYKISTVTDNYRYHLSTWSQSPKEVVVGGIWEGGENLIIEDLDEFIEILKDYRKFTKGVFDDPE